MKSGLWTLACLGCLCGCSNVAVWSSPQKEPAPLVTPEATKANDLFWETFHGGHYDQIPVALETLERIYVAHPTDPTITAHIGFLHAWALTERARLDPVPALIVDHAALGRKYFEQAMKLAPDDPRFEGFYGDLLMTEGTLDGDEHEVREGYYAAKESRDRWFEFNAFTLAFVLSAKPAGDPLFVDSVAAQFQTLDICYRTVIDRKNPDIENYLGLEATETDSRRRRACWNSWIAPHNLEGFFLNWGDMLVKQGDVATARIVYADAKKVPQYKTWQFKDVLDKRLAAADANIEAFRVPGPGKEPIMFNARFACMACHLAP